MSISYYNIGSLDNPIYVIGSNNNWILIEGGISAQFFEVKKKLVALVGSLKNVKHWIILHTHYDHCGLLSYLYPSFPSIQVWAGSKATAKLKKDKGINVIDNLNDDVIELKNYSHDFQDLNRINIKNININSLVDFQEISFGEKLVFTVIPSSGHSECSISLFEHSNKILFVSDALGEYFSIDEWFPLAFYSISNYIESIIQLRTIKPKIIALGHGDFVTEDNVNKAFVNSIQCTNRLIEKVQYQLQTESQKNIAKNLNKKYSFNSKDFVPDYLHYLSMKRLVEFISNY